MPRQREPVDGEDFALAARVSVTHLNKWYGSRQVLRNISLDVLPHERLIICGASGSGKSTLLRCINGLEPHQSGRVVVDGTELTGAPKTLEIVRREVGMVFQSFNLFPHLTAMENCTLAPIWVRKMPPEDAQATALEYLDRVHLSAHAHQYPERVVRRRTAAGRDRARPVHEPQGHAVR